MRVSSSGRARRHRGTLSTTLLIFVLVVGVMVVTTATTMFQLNLRREDDARDGARRLAESAVRLAIARLLADPSLTQETCPLVEVSLESYPDSKGYVALAPAEAARLQIPISVNNLTGTGSRPGWGDTVVAQESASIVGVGRWRDHEQRIEAILHRPKYPYVISSSVPIRASGLHLFGVKDPGALSRGFGSVPPEAREPGHIVTNAPDSGAPSLQLLGETTLIEGDAQSRGTLKVDGGAVVTGELRPLADTTVIPRIDIPGLDTASKPGVSTLDSGSLGATTLSGFNRREGPLAVTGGLSLDGAVLYVNGGVSIRGGLSGTGAVIATGPVTIEGGGALSGLSGTAVISTDDIRMEGTEAQRAGFRGLLYTEGNLTCRHVDVAGAVVVNSARADGRVSLESASCVENPDLGVVTVPVVTATAGTPPDMVRFPDALQSNLVCQGDPFGFGVTPRTKTLPGTSQTAPTLFTPSMNAPLEDYDNPPAGYPITHPPTREEPWYEIGVPATLPDDPITLGSFRIDNMDPNGVISEIGVRGDGWEDSHRAWSDRASARVAMIEVAQAWGSTSAEAAADRVLTAADEYITQQLPEIVRIWNLNSRALGMYRKSGGSGPSQTVTSWKIDLNEFYNVSDSIRLLSWRSL